MARIDEIAGIEPKDATKLRKAGIRTTESTLAQSGNEVGPGRAWRPIWVLGRT